MGSKGPGTGESEGGRATGEGARLLRDLARKYEALHGWRLANTPDLVPRAELAALAREFPGALRALDMFAMEELTARRAELAEALREGRPPNEWMSAELAFHGFMRAALRIRKLLLGRQTAPLPADASGLGYRPGAGEPAAELFDREALSAIAQPPGGRLEAWALDRVAGSLGTTVGDLNALLHPWRA